MIESSILGNSNNKSLNTILRIIILLALLFPSAHYSLQPTPKDLDRKLDSLWKRNAQKKISQDVALKAVLRYYSEAKSIGYDNGILISGLFAQISYSNKYDYENVIRISNEIEKLVEKSNNYEYIIDYYKCLAGSYLSLGLYRESYGIYQKAKRVVSKIADPDARNYCISMIYLDLASCHEGTAGKDSTSYYLEKAMFFGKKISRYVEFEKIGRRNEWLMNLNAALGAYNIQKMPKNIDKARAYFSDAEKMYDVSRGKISTISEIILLTNLCEFYYNDHNYDEALKYGLRSLEIEETEPLPIARKSAYEYIAKSYQKLGINDKYRIYIDKYSELNNILIRSDRRKKSASVDYLISKKDIDDNHKYKVSITIICTAVTVVLFFLMFFWRRKNKKLQLKYLSIIENIESNKQSTLYVSKQQPIAYEIPEETYIRLSQKLKKFENNSGFLKKEVSLSYLANQFKTNPKTLSLIIKSNTDKNFNFYLNDLRINYIIKKLYDDKRYREYKIEFLAEECGYSSSKVFVNAFKKTTDVTPSYYISNLKKEKLYI